MTEPLMILLMAVCGTLFTIGGTGWKPARRYILPLVLSGFAVYSHVIWWRALGLAVCLIVALSMGYGDRTPYWRKILVFSCYGASFLWVGWTWWVVFTPILCLATFLLSNLKVTEEAFFWKGVEFLWGVLLAITLIDALT